MIGREREGADGRRVERDNECERPEFGDVLRYFTRVRCPRAN
jgi:hypothetical protein